MDGPDHHHRRSTNKPDDLQNKHLTERDRADLRIVNAALDSLLERKIFASRDPYILTIPQDDHLGYRHRTQYQAHQFAYNTPFHRDEWENLQYQTYHYHDPGSSLYKQHVSNYPDANETPEKVVRTPSTGPKKVMSFNAYKKAKIGIPPSTDAPAPDKSNAVKDPVERVKAESADILAAAVHEDEKINTSQETPLKRKREEDTTVNGDKPHKIETTTTPPSKKQRKDDKHPDHEELERKQLASIPPKLSPLRDMQPALPAKLSPTIPLNIDTALWQRRQATSKPADTLDAANGVSKHKSPVPKNGFRTTSQSPASLPDHAANEGKDRSLLVKLKLDASKKASSKANGHPSAHKTTSKPVVEKAQPKTTKPGTTRTAEETANTKTSKTTGARPTTPAKQLSPESVRATPGLRKEAHSTAMQRIQSSDGMPKTPTDMNTPLANGHDSKTPSKPPAPKTAAQRVWETERNKYDALGRSLKHACQDHGRAKPPETDLAAVKALESMISYLLAFTCSDEASAAAEPKQPPSLKVWTGLTQWYDGVRRTCAHTPLASIASVLGLAFASHVLSLMTTSSRAQDAATYKDYIDLLRSSSLELSNNLNLKTIQASYPESWRKSKASLTASALDAGKLMSVEFQLPVGVHTSPIQAALAARSLLEEWLEKSTLKYKLQV